MTKRLAIIDGKSVFYRGYYSMPTLATKDGTPTGGVYGFAALSLEVIKKLKPDYVAVAWDKPKTNIRRRKELYPDYKAGRKPAPPDFYTQIPILHELLEAFGWPLYEYDDYEADDIMGALAMKANEQGIEACLITSDLDMLQLVGPLTHVYAMKKGFTDIQMYNPETFKEKYNLDVHQFLDLKSLKGDSSDNIPGVPGIGEKTAIELLKQFDSLDNLYQHVDEIARANTKDKLAAGKDSAYLSKELARIWIDAPAPLDLEAMDVTKFNKAKLKKLLTDLEFRSLLRQMASQLEDIEEVVEEKPEIDPAVVKTFDDAAKTNLIMADKLVVVERGDDWLVSHDSTLAYLLPRDQAAQLLGSQKIIAHDVKSLLKTLIAANVKTLPIVEHDTRIANFLLNSLDRNHELDEISGIDLAQDEDGSYAVAAVWQLYQQQTEQLKTMPKVEKLAREIEFPTISLLAKVEMRGVLLDTKLLADMSTKFEAEIKTIEQTMYGYVDYEFNIGSPSQLANVLYGKLQLPTVGIKKGKTGYSTGASELDKLRGTHPIIDDITKYREYTKLKSTYIDTLPKLVDSVGKLHTTYALDVAATGRLSSHDPNLQNIPIRSELGRAIRDAFVPAKGNVFVGADYSQFELRLAAVLADDTELIDDFNGDLDIHAKTASDVHGIPIEQITKAQRRDAKVINFGVLYGMSPHGLAAATGMTFMAARDFIAKYFELRAKIRVYIDKTLEKANTDGYVETLFGRRRPTPDVKSSNFIVREAAKRAAANMPIQGTEADLMKIAMLHVEEKLGDLGKQVLQIHDSILVECKEVDAEKVGKLVQEIMENVYPDLGIKLKVDVSIGKNWGEV